MAIAITSTSCQNLSSPGTGQAHPDDASAHRVKMLVENDGFFAVSRRDLVSGGLEIDEMSSTKLNLSQNGIPVPFLIQDDRLIFYGQAPQSRYTNIRPYILTTGQGGSVIQVVDTPKLSTPRVTNVPQTVRLEENHIYTAEARKTDEDDVWFWKELRQRESFDTLAEIPHLSKTPARIRINSWGFTYNPEVEGDHDFDLLVNDEFIDNVLWDGQIYYSSDTILPAGILTSGINKITLDNSAEGASFLDIMHVNWLELDYQAPAIAVNDQLTFSAVDGLVQMSGFSDKPQIFNISDAANPELLAGWEYDENQFHLPVSENMLIAAVGPDGYSTPTIEIVRESDWRNPEQQADLIIITTDELASSLTPLVQERQDQGLSVALVHDTDIYDEFGHGETTPDSILSFVTYAYTNWQEPRPRYLFLVGDATTDYLGYASKLPDNVVPSLLVPVQFSGETVSDSRLTDIDGDLRPDMAVGRWPVQTPEEVRNLVERTLVYEQGYANEKAIFVADGSEPRFRDIVTRVAKTSQIPEKQVQHLFGAQIEDLAKQMNEEAWLTTYVGHGSITRWGKEGILSLETVNTLEGTTPPIILQLTCLTGLFAHPDEISLVEAMLTHPEGPVLTVAATSLTLSGHQETFAVQLLQQMQDSNIIRIGDAFQEAKLTLDIDNANGLREISDTFALFGDPSTLMVRP